MQDNPPYSIVEIRLLLSQYLDGTLDAATTAEVNALLQTYPAYQEEFLKQQATRQALQDATSVESEPPPSGNNDLWQNIARQLADDQDAPPMACDFEFISAYYDGEVPSSNPAFASFEAQLYHNDEANRILAEVGHLSETLRNFGYRLEEACTLDISQQVMAAYRAETGQAQATEAEEPPVDATFEMLSAYADGELSQRDTIKAGQLIESDERARQTLHQLNRISAGMQALSEQLQAQAPDLWPALQAQLETEKLESGKVIQLARQRRKQALKIAIPMAAAAAFVLLVMPTTQVTPVDNSAHQTPETHQLASAVPMSALNRADQPPTVIPVSHPSPSTMKTVAAASSFGSNGASPAMMAPAPAAMGTVFEDDAPPSASVALENTPKPEHRAGAKKAPSSEEYLFNALNEQMPNEDVSAILGL